jgi:hypothetical protein
MCKVIIRPLEIVAWQWRNDSEVWALTVSSPDKFITPEIEKDWIEQVLNRENEKRFAICIGNYEQELTFH